MNQTNDRDYIFINSPKESGIGEFGLKLNREFEKNLKIKYLEITPSWQGFIRLWKHIISQNSHLIFNLGFTSFGKSILRNFLNFVMLKILTFIHPQLTVILHDSIDTTDLKNSGYRNSRLISWGGTFATKKHKRCEIFVFSKHFSEILAKKYGFKSVNYFPFPCENESMINCYEKDKPLLLLNLGYIAPYKGLDILPSIKKKSGNIRTIVIGNFHKTLLSTKKGVEFKKSITAIMDNSGIEMPGYIDDTDLMKMFSENQVIAILPYISGYNASYSAIYFVTRGIPVISSKIDVFRESYESGAGILLVNRTPEAFSSAITKLKEDPIEIKNMIEKDINYCSKFSFSSLCNYIISVCINNKSD
ncbi:MAG: glycosyltransferase [Thermoplasmataceae archaeon]